MKSYLALFFLIVSVPLFGDLNVTLHSDAAILINADTGAIIYEKNAHDSHYPASITKVATALYALEKQGGRMDEVVTANRSSVASVTERQRHNSNYSINPHWIEVGGSHIGIKAGEKLPFEALLYGLLLASGNDAANVIAQHVGQGSIDRFVDGMNQYVSRLGCKNTHFVCVHGHHHPDHVTTAYDMSLIAQKAMKNSQFRKIVVTEKFRRPETNKQNPVTLVQTNKLIRKGSQFYYDKAIGIKTGHGSHAKDTLVAAAEYQGRTLIAVMLHANKRRHIFEDATQLFDAAFKQPKMAMTVAEAGPQKYSIKIPGASRPVRTYIDEPLRFEYHRGEESGVKAWITWEEGLTLPVQKGQKVGEVVLGRDNHHVLMKADLKSAEQVAQSLWEDIKRSYQEFTPYSHIFLGLLIFWIVFKLVARLIR